MNKKFTILILSILVIIGIVFIQFQRPAFNVNKVAKAETEMWQAYYTDNKAKLGLLLISLLQTQYGLTLSESKEAGELFASSAMKFHATRKDYNSIVLPDLTAAYRVIKDAKKLSFDPKQAAEVELAWWVARRVAGKNSVEQVGSGIGKLYAIIYGQERSEFKKAGLLRAKAAAIRDKGGKNADWQQIENLLRQSYKELGKGIKGNYEKNI